MDLGIGAMVSLAGSAVTAAGTLASGAAAKSQADAQAAMMRRQAAEKQAAGQQAAFAQERKGNYALSQLQARAAASGGGAADPTVVNLAEDIGGETKYASLSKIYEGKSAADNLNYSADITKMSGEAAQRGSYFGAGGSLLAGVGGMYRKFGVPMGAEYGYGNSGYG